MMFALRTAVALMVCLCFTDVIVVVELVDDRVLVLTSTGTKQAPFRLPEKAASKGATAIN